MTRSALRESLSRYRVLGDRTGIVLCLEAFGMMAVAGSADRRAARLFAVASAVREKLIYPIPAVDHKEYAETLAGIESRLGLEAFPATWSPANAMLLDLVIHEIDRRTVAGWAGPVDEPGLTATDRPIGQPS